MENLSINPFFEQSEPDINEFIKLISCPKSEKIYFLPIVDKKKIYEYEEYLKLDKNNDIIIFTQLKSLIISFLDAFPEYEKLRYVPTISNKPSHIYSKTIINNSISKKKFELLLNYTNFKMKLFTVNDICILLEAPNNILKYFINNCDDINYEFDSNRGWSLINYACNKICRKNPKIIKYLIKNGADIQHICKDDGWSPLYQIIHFSNKNSLIKYAIIKHLELGMDLYMTNKNNSSIIDTIFAKQNFKIIQFALQKINITDKQFKDSQTNILNFIMTNKLLSDENRDTIFKLFIQ